MNDTDVKLPSPPWKSLTAGRPLSLYVGIIGRPPPTWNTIGTPASCGHRPQRVEADVGRAVVAGAERREHQRVGAGVERLAADLDGPLDRGERHPARRQQPRVGRAEVDDRPVVGAGGAERQLLVVTAVERRQRVEVEAGEDQLAVEAERGRARSRGRCRPTPRGRRSSCAAAAPGRRRLAGPRGRRGPSSVGPSASPPASGARRSRIVRVGVGLEEPDRLHDVGIGVVDDAPGRVGAGRRRVVGEQRHEDPPVIRCG